jgi:hypothetical protein
MKLLAIHKLDAYKLNMILCLIRIKENSGREDAHIQPEGHTDTYESIACMIFMEEEYAPAAAKQVSSSILTCTCINSRAPCGATA